MMIKWGRRKKKLASSPRPSLLSSWFLRLKKMGVGNGGGGGGGKDNPAPVKADVAPFCSSSRSRKPHNSSSSGQYEEFYGGDEGFWRLSFRKEKVCGYETEAEEEEEADDKREGMNNFSEMVSGIRRMKELQRISTAEELKAARDFKTRTPMTRKMKLLHSSPSSSLLSRRIKKGLTASEEDDYVFSPRVPRFQENDAGPVFSDSVYQRRKSVYVNRVSAKRRPKHSSYRVRVVSPRVSGGADVNGRVKSNSIKDGILMKGGFDRFAVVKCSFDPERDFMDSMLDMILDTNICGSQELEDLLACYLALNSDEYHHLIIKVFRQIWFALNHST